MPAEVRDKVRLDEPVLKKGYRDRSLPAQSPRQREAGRGSRVDGARLTVEVSP